MTEPTYITTVSFELRWSATINTGLPLDPADNPHVYLSFEAGDDVTITLRQIEVSSVLSDSFVVGPDDDIDFNDPGPWIIDEIKTVSDYRPYHVGAPDVADWDDVNFTFLGIVITHQLA